MRFLWIPLLTFTLANVVVEAIILPSSTSPAADDGMHSWCDKIGIEINPSVRVLTTPASVAGRGVFAIEPLVENEIIAYIPTYAIFHPTNAENMFPRVAAQIQERRQRMMKCSSAPTTTTSTTTNASKTTNHTVKPTRKWLGVFRRIFARLRSRKSKQMEEKDEATEEEDEDDNERPWQAELTEYALAVLKEEQGHPLEPWIKQWQRDDPVHRLFQKQGAAGITTDDIEATAKELHNMVPDLSFYKILAALNIRLEQYQAFHSLLGNPLSSETASMYTTVTSRTIGVAPGITAVVPFHDMLNHCFEPNVGLAISDDGRKLELYALRDVTAGQELFLCYTTIGEPYDEDAAVWLLVQWGIPVPQSEWKVASARDFVPVTSAEEEDGARY